MNQERTYVLSTEPIEFDYVPLEQQETQWKTGADNLLTPAYFRIHVPANTEVEIKPVPSSKVRITNTNDRPAQVTFRSEPVREQS